MKTKKRIISIISVCVLLVAALTGCDIEYGESIGQDVKQQITGLTYTMDGFDNYGHKTLTVHGEHIRIDPNIVYDRIYGDGGWSTVKTESSVVTITIDGHELDSCGDTLIFYEDDLIPDYNFYTQMGLKTIDQLGNATDNVVEDEVPEIDSESDGSTSADYAFVGYMANNYKNLFGKKRVVLIKSQMGTPIYAFSGDSIYWEVSQNLPKCTKLSVDGKALYIHRANFQLIDTELLSDIDEFGMNKETNAEKVEQQKENGAEDEGLNIDEDMNVDTDSDTEPSDEPLDVDIDNSSDEAKAIIDATFSNIIVEDF